MIRPRLQQVAKKQGISNAYQLQKLTDFPVGMAYRLWKRDWKQVDLKTLNTLCNLLKCTPNDLLEFTVDPDHV